MDNIQEITIGSIQRVFGGMVPIEVAIGTISSDTASQVKGDVMAMVGIAGKQVSGTISMFVSAKLATKMASLFLGRAIETIGNEVFEIVGEITNIIAGGITAALSTDEIFKFSMPTVMMINNQGIYYPSSDIQYVAVPVHAEDADFFITTAIKYK